MPYRIDLPNLGTSAVERLIDLGALDADQHEDGRIAAVIPDHLTPQRLAEALGIREIAISPAVGRDADSVWVLNPGAIRIGRQSLELIDSSAFGTGLHPTTALCLELIDELLQRSSPERVLDVGTGSGVLALAALIRGVPTALGLDVDEDALSAAARNADLNHVGERLRLIRGGPEAAAGTWPLVLANISAAILIDMAPSLVRRVGHHAELVLSGISSSLEREVANSYRRLGMHPVDARSRAGWSALVFQASW